MVSGLEGFHCTISIKINYGSLTIPNSIHTPNHTVASTPSGLSVGAVAGVSVASAFMLVLILSALLTLCCLCKRGSICTHCERWQESNKYGNQEGIQMGHRFPEMATQLDSSSPDMVAERQEFGKMFIIDCILCRMWHIIHVYCMHANSNIMHSYCTP